MGGSGQDWLPGRPGRLLEPSQGWLDTSRISNTMPAEILMLRSLVRHAADHAEHEAGNDSSAHQHGWKWTGLAGEQAGAPA